MTVAARRLVSMNKTKPAAPASAATSPGTPLRGVELVDAVMTTRKRTRGMPASQLAALTLGDKPLTPALQRWLEIDSTMFTLGQPQLIGELLEAEFDEWFEAFARLGKYLQAPCVLFEGWGSDSRRFLYLGETDDHGEYPVFTVDIDDTPFACINGPVDVWLAQHAGFLEDEKHYGYVPEAYEPARQAVAKLNFGGYVAFLDGAFSKTLG